MLAFRENGPSPRPRVLESLEDVAALRRDWERLRSACGGSLFSSHHWTMEWLKHFSDVVEPRVLALERKGELMAVAPFVLSRKRSMGVGLRTLSMAGWANDTLEYYDVGVLQKPGEYLLAPIMDGLGKMDWNSLQLNGLPACPFHEALCQEAGARWSDVQVERLPCPCIDISGEEDVASLFGTRNRRTVRKLLRELGEADRLEMRTLRSPKEMERAMVDYVEMHKVRWASRGGSIFQEARQRDFLVSMARMAAERSEGCVYEARIDGELGAQALCFLEGSKARVYRISMNEAMVDYSPGYLLFHEMLTDLRQKGVRIADLGAGAEEFKYRLGAKDAFVLGLRARRGGLVLASRMGSMPGVREVLDRTGLRKRALVSVG